MISEPELSGDPDDPRPLDIVTGYAGEWDAGPRPGYGSGRPGGRDRDQDWGQDRDLDDGLAFEGPGGPGFGPGPGSDGGPRPAARVRPPWVWVLGGAVIASALWGGGLLAYDRGHTGAPALHGYALGESPCAGPVLKPLLDAVGASESQGSPAITHRGPALDQVRCEYSADAPYAQGGTTTYTVSVSVDLHKKADPRVEFQDQVRLEGSSLSTAGTVVSVPGLGDEAYFLTRGDQGQELKLRHGGAVFDLTLIAYSDVNVSNDTLNGLGGGPYPLAPDLTQYQPALIETVRNMMVALRRH